ncbi:olfactory receptor 51B4-like [Eubalaena glacialis]|uniref:olfactory receptor 51B4-like n=1 Tax=Eubalaena glacialis TaxID=27606 RepID=UPI002A598B9C|nr:olfactory receptor 51B4-like [Eubalaena glacialis]
MWSKNSAASFFLTGFLGSEAIHHWISLPFFTIYLSILLGNGTLLFLIWNDHSLHEPMYYFLAMLAGTDLGMTLTTMPYSIKTKLSFMESSVLTTKSFDYHVVICYSLHYASIFITRVS